jgi:hypothetical protein
MIAKSHSDELWWVASIGERDAWAVARRHFHGPPAAGGRVLLEGGLAGAEEPVIEDDSAGEPFGGEERAA